jgi:hypothetical protein
MISLAKDLQLETRRAVCETFAFLARRGTFSSYLSSLRRAGVIEERDGHIFPNAEFV